MGILFALGALACWGVGDFLIQRSARKFGDGIALFFICAVGTAVLLPFVWSDIPAMFTVSRTGIILWGASLVLLAAALLDFEALRVGKLSVIEPIYSLEIAVAAVFGYLFLNERLTAQQMVLMAVLIGGITLVSLERLRTARRLRIERGVLLAIAATVLMGAVDVLFGAGARETSPLVINWFTDAFITLVMAIYLTALGEWHHIKRQWQTNKPLILSVGFLDQLAWVLYSYSMLFIPVAIATGISESYIVLASLLGLWLNRERLRNHQFAGLIITVLAAIALAMTLE